MSRYDDWDKVPAPDPHHPGRIRELAAHLQTATDAAVEIGRLRAELDEARRRADQFSDQLLRAGTELLQADTKLAQVKKLAVALSDTGPRAYVGSEVSRMLCSITDGTP